MAGEPASAWWRAFLDFLNPPPPAPVEPPPPIGRFEWWKAGAWGIAGWAAETANFAAGGWGMNFTAGGQWFSTGDQEGALRQDGGWVLYLVDQTGLWSFGDWWPAVGWVVLTAIVVLLVSLISYGVRTALQLVRAIIRLWNLLGIWKVPDIVEELLPPPKAGIGPCVTWYGPDTRRFPDTHYLQTVVKGAP